MDSERRHEIEKNDLDVILRVKAPEFFQKHAANLLLGILLLAAIGYFLWQRRSLKEATLHATNQNTAIAYNNAIELRAMASRPDISDDAAHDRQALASSVFAAADQVLGSDSDVTQKSAAQLAKAEALWALASTPAKALATTQPVAGFVAKTPAAYLNDAKAAYFEILTKYPDQKEIAANALLSLAAICESNSAFDDADDWYSKVIRDDSLRSVYREVAKARRERLSDLRKPFTLAPPWVEPTSQPATQPTDSPPTTIPVAVP